MKTCCKEIFYDCARVWGDKFSKSKQIGVKRVKTLGPKIVLNFDRPLGAAYSKCWSKCKIGMLF